MTLREFADRIGADPGYLSKIENGKASNVSRRFIVRVGVAFRVNEEWIRSGKGDRSWTASGDERTKKALPGWSEKRLQRIMAVMDELPDALAAEAVLGCIFDRESLEGFQTAWHNIMDRVYPDIPATARLFWNDVYTRVELAKHDDEMQRKSHLTDAEIQSRISEVKVQLPGLLKRLEKATAEPGKKTALAKFLTERLSARVPLASVSRWLSGEREPGGEVTLQLLRWVEFQERGK